MKKRLVTVVVVICALALSACQDESIDSLIDETELNQSVETDDDDDEGPAGPDQDKEGGYK